MRAQRTEFSFSSSAILCRCSSLSFCSDSARDLRSVIRHFWRSRKRRCAALHKKHKRYQTWAPAYTHGRT